MKQETNNRLQVSRLQCARLASNKLFAQWVEGKKGEGVGMLGWRQGVCGVPGQGEDVPKKLRSLVPWMEQLWVHVSNRC